MLGTFLPAGKYRLFCLNNTHGSSQGCVQVMKAMILFKFGIRHLERPTLKAEFHSQKERDDARYEEPSDTDKKKDTLLGEEAISCLSKSYANDDDDNARFINDVADRIIKGGGEMCTAKQTRQFSGNTQPGNVNSIIDNLDVFYCDDVDDDDSICNKLKKKCAEKMEEKKEDYWKKRNEENQQRKERDKRKLDELEKPSNRG